MKQEGQDMNKTPTDQTRKRKGRHIGEAWEEERFRLLNTPGRLPAMRVGELLCMDVILIARITRTREVYEGLSFSDLNSIARRVADEEGFATWRSAHSRLLETPTAYEECRASAMASIWQAKYLLLSRFAFQNFASSFEAFRDERGEVKKEEFEKELVRLKRNIETQYRRMYAFHAFLDIIGKSSLLSLRGKLFKNSLPYIYPEIDLDPIADLNRFLIPATDDITHKRGEEQTSGSFWIDYDGPYSPILPEKLLPSPDRIEAAAKAWPRRGAVWVYSNMTWGAVVSYIAGFREELI